MIGDTPYAPENEKQQNTFEKQNVKMQCDFDDAIYGALSTLNKYIRNRALINNAMTLHMTNMRSVHGPIIN